jgi:hypothetical protein
MPESDALSTMMSMSLSGRSSPCAQEPNSAACATPRARRSASFAFSRTILPGHNMIITGSGAFCVQDWLGCRFRLSSGHWEETEAGARAGHSIESVELGQERWVIRADARGRRSCPSCGQSSSSRHSWHVRRLQDFPIQGIPAIVELRLARWRCHNETCTNRTFVERLPGLVTPFARRTSRLGEIVRLFGHAAGGGSVKGCCGGSPCRPAAPFWSRDWDASEFQNSIVNASSNLGKARAREGAGPVTLGIDLGYIKTILSQAVAVHGVVLSTEPIALARIALARLGRVGKGNERDRRPTQAQLDRANRCFRCESRSADSSWADHSLCSSDSNAPRRDLPDRMARF